jgi:hypothetical protein
METVHALTLDDACNRFLQVQDRTDDIGRPLAKTITLTVVASLCSAAGSRTSMVYPARSFPAYDGLKEV